MSRNYRLGFIISLFVLGFALIPAIISAQDDTTETTTQANACDTNMTTAIETVQQSCSGLAYNGVCYGNTDVDAIPRDEDFANPFETPGDTVDVGNVRSLYLSELDTTLEHWGIAQMHLIANLASAPESILILLFGDTRLEGMEASPEFTAETMTADLQITREGTNVLMRSQPNVATTALDALNPGEVVQGIARLADSSWVRVRETDEFGRVGWIDASLLDAATDPSLIEALPVHQTDTPYWGPMQALYFRSEASAACGESITDGMLIQTPQGAAQLSLLINEVSIELVASGQSGATAYVDTDGGMNLSMLEGTANVTVAGTTTQVGTNQRVTIPMSEPTGDSAFMQPTGPASVPVFIQTPLSEQLVLLDVVQDENTITNINPASQTNPNAAVPVTSPTATHTLPPPPTATPTIIPTATNTPTITPTPTNTPTPTATRELWDTNG